jgi:vacuolar-type H+-ATPase subunit I/STV1
MSAQRTSWPELPPDLTEPSAVMARLASIENDLAERQNDYEEAARSHFDVVREQKKAWATALLTADAKSVTEKKAQGEVAAYYVEGGETEAEYQALKAVVEVLSERASICQSILKAQSRA